MDKENMVKLVRAYIDHLEYVQGCYDAYCSIITGAERYNDEINYSPEFFTITRFALNHQTLLGIARLFNRKPGEGTIQVLRKQASANQNLFKRFDIESNALDISGVLNPNEFCVLSVKDYLERVQKRFDELEPVWMKFKSRRNLYLAHNDRSVIEQDYDPIEKYPITPEDIDTLLRFAWAFCNRLLGNLADYYVFPHSAGSDDLLNLLEEFHSSRIQK